MKKRMEWLMTYGPCPSCGGLRTSMLVQHKDAAGERLNARWGICCLSHPTSDREYM